MIKSEDQVNTENELGQYGIRLETAFNCLESVGTLTVKITGIELSSRFFSDRIMYVFKRRAP